ncbi:long-chain-fatty-acid--CoA ligase 4-like [Amphibalanus amphitrite]|uniref:long-chain-fatty-acid--CoA ligase 4-like n=1 Tax=Amphibalanus amphitrite TaxID=1232801 RepID=UPI001C8FF4A9|nr:long-chain-fatty-acid--CoA ligase 4-like [Amphibalanus amphitrite]XP_043235258.1 long-chain-fatty-acid--CoA ligase 4-like [Amphibalanus amphitrite]XP_043235259.1 long-chain-fatty-acid--CoA ligase 4-like [Amphibalanus amphitrite]
MEDQLEKTDTSGVKSGVKVIPFADMLKKGHDAKFEAHPPTSDDIAIIMYTSGSTGTPKGVMVSHYNMVSTMTGFAVALVPSPEDVYLGYLPLAHVLELMAELCAVMFGVPIGYSSPLTLMDKSSKIKRGCQGDCSVLRPTLMAAVPMILDRVAQGIKEQMHSAGRLAQGLFNWFVMYRNWWRRRGFSTPILHSLVFSRIAGLLGGRVRAMVSGGAPLSEVTHDLIRSCIGCSVMQGYGLTETTSCASLMDEYDVAVGRVGHPVSCCDVQLSDWEEGGYKVTDQPHPRGEIVVGGDNVTMGYFKQPEKTKEEFFESDGRRWFRTGDIGLIYPNGTIKIVDRKKDLVKLQAGRVRLSGTRGDHPQHQPLRRQHVRLRGVLQELRRGRGSGQRQAAGLAGKGGAGVGGRGEVARAALQGGASGGGGPEAAGQTGAARSSGEGRDPRPGGPDLGLVVAR